MMDGIFHSWCHKLMLSGVAFRWHKKPARRKKRKTNELRKKFMKMCEENICFHFLLFLGALLAPEWVLLIFSQRFSCIPDVRGKFLWREQQPSTVKAKPRDLRERLVRRRQMRSSPTSLFGKSNQA
jgi:hypothetical protein